MGEQARHIDTGGGAYIEGTVRAARDFIGHDQINHYHDRVTQHFYPRPAGPGGDRQPYFAGQPFRATDHDIGLGNESGDGSSWS